MKRFKRSGSGCHLTGRAMNNGSPCLLLKRQWWWVLQGNIHYLKSGGIRCWMFSLVLSCSTFWSGKVQEMPFQNVFQGLIEFQPGWQVHSSSLSYFGKTKPDIADIPPALTLCYLKYLSSSRCSCIPDEARNVSYRTGRSLSRRN